MRYKLLTNFVNAYKEKMYLTGGTSKDENEQEVTLQEMKQQENAERSDITLDYEQFT